MNSKKMSWNLNGMLKNTHTIEDYINKISKRDKDSLINLYNITKSAIYGYILSMIKNPHIAEELMHDVYIKIYEKAHTYKSEGKPLAWIFTLSKNICLMYKRQENTTVCIDEMLNFIASDKLSSNIIDKVVLETAFTKISDEERNIVFLHILGGLKHKEIAKLQEIPLSTVLSKYSRAIKKLKKLLKEDIYEL